MLQKTNFIDAQTLVIAVIVGVIIILFFVIFFYLFIVQLHRRRVIHQKEMFELKAQYEQAIFQSQLEIQEQTFRNISQEIHDNIGQVLSLAKLNLNTIESQVEADKIALSEQLLGKAINDLRDLSKSLNPEKITDIGLVNAIKHELLVVQKAANITTELLTDQTSIHIENDKSIIIFRMIQEILNNILKHAKARTVVVSITQNADKTTIEIKDDGIGFDPNNMKSTETGLGLKSIQQRCTLIHATCNITSEKGIGTTVKLVINNS